MRHVVTLQHAVSVVLFGLLAGLLCFAAEVEAEPVVIAQPHVNATELLLWQHGCWSGAAPKDMRGKMPGAVVVTLPGMHQAVYTRSPKVVGRALEAAVPPYKAWAGVQVHGFCR